MKKSICILMLLVGCTSTTPSKNQTSPSEIPLKDFFKNPEQGRFQISPQAGYISMMKPWNSRMNVFVQKLSADRLPTGEPRQVTFVKDRDIAYYQWKNESTLIYSKDFGGDENFHVFAVNIQAGTERDLTAFEKTRAEVVDDLEDVSDTDVLVQMNKRNPEAFDVYRLNTQTGDLKMVAENPGKIISWGTDHNGQVRVAIESDGLITRVMTRKSNEGQFKPIIQHDYTSEISPALFSFDNKTLYVLSNLKNDKVAVVQINPETGREMKKIFSHPDVDAQSLRYSKKRKVITAAEYTTWKQEVKFFDKVEENRYNRIKKEIGNYDIYYSSHNKNEDLFTVTATSDRSRGRIYLYDETKDRLTFLADVAPWLNPALLSEMKPVQYQTRDGLTVHGYLTLPDGVMSAKNLPVIVNPHGGPWARDEWRFNPEIQFLASRGYAVFQMNFRGSTGYGKKFLNSSFKQWGKTMQNDITDGVKYLTDQGIADAKRICIYGGSYGGYATLAGIAFTPDLYACAVDYVGVSNLFTFMKTIPPYWKPFLQKMYAMVGDPVKDKDLLASASPVFHVDKIKTPLFVVQGAKDPRVNIEESNQIVDSLRKRGVQVQYMVKENEGHGFRNEENKFEFYQAMEKFIKTHIN